MSQARTIVVTVKCLGSISLVVIDYPRLSPAIDMHVGRGQLSAVLLLHKVIFGVLEILTGLLDRVLGVARSRVPKW